MCENSKPPPGGAEVRLVLAALVAVVAGLLCGYLGYMATFSQPESALVGWALAELRS